MEKKAGAPGEVWPKLSIDAQRMALYISHGEGRSQGKPFLEAMSQDAEMGFDLNEAMEELLDLGLLEETNIIKEHREKLAGMDKPDRLESTPDSLTDTEREYFRILSRIEDYDANPEKHKSWEKPRFRLTHDFQSFIEVIRKK